jgi:predicted Holliday junction resolvase-like endonuclease
VELVVFGGLNRNVLEQIVFVEMKSSYFGLTHQIPPLDKEDAI